MKVLLACALCILSKATTIANELYSRDPNVVYSEEDPDSNLIVEIPGYKLDPHCGSMIAIGPPDREFARRIDPKVLAIASGYVLYGGLSFRGEFSLYAAKELGSYILLYFAEPAVVDGGFELVYSKELKNIVGMFFAGSKDWTYEALPLEGATDPSHRFP